MQKKISKTSDRRRAHTFRDQPPCVIVGCWRLPMSLTENRMRRRLPTVGTMPNRDHGKPPALSWSGGVEPPPQPTNQRSCSAFWRLSRCGGGAGRWSLEVGRLSDGPNLFVRLFHRLRSTDRKTFPRDSLERSGRTGGPQNIFCGKTLTHSQLRGFDLQKD